MGSEMCIRDSFIREKDLPVFPPCPGGIGDLICLPHHDAMCYVNLIDVKMSKTSHQSATHRAVSPAYALNFSNATNVITVWGPRRT